MVAGPRLWSVCTCSGFSFHRRHNDSCFVCSHNHFSFALDHGALLSSPSSQPCCDGLTQRTSLSLIQTASSGRLSRGAHLSRHANLVFGDSGNPRLSCTCFVCFFLPFQRPPFYRSVLTWSHNRESFILVEDKPHLGVMGFAGGILEPYRERHDSHLVLYFSL